MGKFLHVFLIIPALGFSTEAGGSIFILDDFYSNPDDVRSFALRQNFSVKGNFPGRRTKSYDMLDTQNRFEKILGQNITYWPKEHNSAFQLTTSEDISWVHFDETIWSGIVYLTPSAPLSSGTIFYDVTDSIENTTCTLKCVNDSKDFQKQQSFQNSETCPRHAENWVEVDRVANKYNRLVLFRGNIAHKSGKYFGNDLSNARLFQTFFFNTDIEKSALDRLTWALNFGSIVHDKKRKIEEHDKGDKSESNSLPENPNKVENKKVNKFFREPENFTPTICLNMIVKNEVAVLPRLFLSVKDFIDSYVISDTGSNDETIHLIEKEMKKYSIPGLIFQDDWINFGHNRNKALQHAYDFGSCNWALIIDADEVLVVNDVDFASKLEIGVNYQLEKHDNSIRYSNWNLLDLTHSIWEWKGVVHEYLYYVGSRGEDDSFKADTLTNVYIDRGRYQGQGARSTSVSQEEKYLKDAELLELDIESNPNNARSMFYLGQSYRDAGHFERALDAYRRRVEMHKKGTGWAEEAFVALLEIGNILMKEDSSISEIIMNNLEAQAICPMRMESLYALSHYLRTKEIFPMAYVFALAGASLPRTPPMHSLFIDHSIYEWRMHDELCISAYWTEHYEEGMKACKTILDREAIDPEFSIPKDDLERVRINLKYNVAKNGNEDG